MKQINTPGKVMLFTGSTIGNFPEKTRNTLLKNLSECL